MTNDNLLPIFASNLREYADVHKSNGVRFCYIAKKAGMSKGHFSDMLRGRIPSPSVWTAQRLAEALWCKVDDLLTTRSNHREAVCMEIAERYARM